MLGVNLQIFDYYSVIGNFGYPYYQPTAVWGGVAHRQADEREYHPLRWSAGMRVRGYEGEQAYSKIAYEQACVWEEILRLPCRAALEDGRAGGISMSLDFFGTFWVKQKSAEKSHEHYPELKIINMNGRLYDPVIGRFFSPDNYVVDNEGTQDFNRYAYARNNPLKYVDPTGNLYWKPDKDGHAIAEEGDDEYTLAKALGITTEEAVKKLKEQGYINEQGESNIVMGNKVILENPFVKDIAAHGNLLTGDAELDYNCWGATWRGVNGMEIKAGEGISEPYTFDKRLQKFFISISPEEAVHGKTAIRFTTDTPYSGESDWDAIPGTFSKDPDALGGALHGAVFYMRSNDGTVYVYTKDGWGRPPQIIKLSDMDSDYGSVRGLNGQSGYYLLRLK